MVPIIGLLYFSLTLPNISYIKPSLDMAYIILGRGSKLPKRLGSKPNNAPMLTIHLAAIHPMASKIDDKGAFTFL